MSSPIKAEEAALAAEPGSVKRAPGRPVMVNAYRLALLIVLLAIWQTAAGTLVPEFFISRPSAIFERLYEWAVRRRGE